MLPIVNTLDEHITLSSVFLEKGANQIIAALWQIPERLFKSS